MILTQKWLEVHSEWHIPGYKELYPATRHPEFDLPLQKNY